MAAAYRVVDRLHSPLNSPLEDTCAASAYLKLHWPTSFQKLQETFLENAGRPNIRYYVKTRDSDDILVLNVYKTNDQSPSWGLGPSPLSPLYILYPALHPADHALPKPPMPLQPKPSLFSPRNKTPIAPPFRSSMLQYIVDRKDFSTHDSTTMVCIRFLEEFVEWRLIPIPPPSTRIAGSPPIPKPLLEKLKLRKPAVILPGPPKRTRDILAANIYLTPRIRLADRARTKSLPVILTSLAQDSLPMYTTVEEAQGGRGISLYYTQPEDDKRTYWWIWEGSSWKCVFDPLDKTECRKSLRVPMAEKKESKETSRFGERKSRRGVECVDVVEKGAEITCGTVKLYGANQAEPLASIELATGQMWIVKNIVVETTDVAVAVMFAVVNLERSIKAEHDMGMEDRRDEMVFGCSF